MSSSFGRAPSKAMWLWAVSGLAVAAAGPAKAGYVVTPPASVPTTFTESSPVTLTNVAHGLNATVWTFLPGIGCCGSNNLEVVAGFPTLQGMANLETLAQNGSITVLPSGLPGTGTGQATYTAASYLSFTDSAINTYHVVAVNGSNVQSFLSGSAYGSLGTNLVSGITLPASASTTSWNNVLFDQSGYVYVAQPNSSYTFAVASNDANDDGTEILLGGNGAVGSGKVVGFENAADIQAANGVATLVDGDTYGAAVDTVTFTQAGYYPFEIFNAQTWGGSGENVSFLPTLAATPDLLFVTGTPVQSSVPEPSAAALILAGIAGLPLLRRRKTAGAP